MTDVLYVLGRWGAGTSLVAEIIRQHGFYFGKYPSPENNKGVSPAGWRNKYGNVEDMMLLHGASHAEPVQTKASLRRIIREAEEQGLRPAIKMPWFLVWPEARELIERESEPYFVYVERPTKPESAYTMLAERQADAVAGLVEWRRHFADAKSYTQIFEDLIAYPEREIEDLAAWLTVEPKLSTVGLVDPDWMRNR